MAARFARYPGAVARTVDVADELAFDLQKARPRLPKLEVPEGHTPTAGCASWSGQGVDRLYLDPAAHAAALDRIEQELEVIEAKDFPGYFLIVHDIVGFAKSQGILCQGRGSAANSAVCYVLGITAVDAMRSRSAVRAVPVDHPRRGARHRRRLRLRPPRGGHPVGLRQVRAAQRRPGRERDHLPAEERGARHGQGARLLARAAGRLVASRSTRWGPVVDHGR